MPRGEQRPADLIGCAVTVARLSAGDLHETPVQPSGKVGSGHAGARVTNLAPEKRREIAKKAAAGRWS
jgi:hypothetical protein